MEHTNKELVRAYTRDVFDRGDAAAVDRYLAPDFVSHVTGRSGTADFRRLAAELRGLPEGSNVIDRMVAEDDLVVAFMTIRRAVLGGATQVGFRVERPGSYTVDHVHTYRISDGRIREHWALRDDLGILPAARRALADVVAPRRSAAARRAKVTIR